MFFWRLKCFTASTAILIFCSGVPLDKNLLFGGGSIRGRNLFVKRKQACEVTPQLQLEIDPQGRGGLSGENLERHI
jgi:hypothetical protein